MYKLANVVHAYNFLFLDKANLLYTYQFGFRRCHARSLP